MQDTSLQEFRVKDLDTGMYITQEEAQVKNMEYILTRKNRARSLDSHVQVPIDLKLSYTTCQMKEQIFSRPTIAEYFLSHNKNVWCLAVSPDGKYAASGGDDGKIVLYSISPIFKQIYVFKEHTSDIVMLEFSKDNFLLSCSLDSTVRLWHPSQQKSLSVFQHDDIVTSISFNPTDSSNFIAATFDNTVFSWSIRDNAVQKRITFASPPTATAFSPDGQHVAVGCLNGFVFIYELPDFDYVTQFVAGPRGKKKTTNEKVTSIEFVDNQKFLVATNDSRIRLYSIDNYSMVRKFVGHDSKDTQLRVSVSGDRKLLMTPSESSDEIYIYPVDHTDYFKSSGLFSSFLKDRSKTAEVLKFGKKFTINVAAFLPNSNANHLSIIVGDDHGGVSYIVSK